MRPGGAPGESEMGGAGGGPAVAGDDDGAALDRRLHLLQRVEDGLPRAVPLSPSLSLSVPLSLSLYLSLSLSRRRGQGDGGEGAAPKAGSASRTLRPGDKWQKMNQENVVQLVPVASDASRRPFLDGAGENKPARNWRGNWAS